MDKNSLIGLGLIGAILFGWMYLSRPSKEEIEQQKRKQDSIAAVNKIIEKQALVTSSVSVNTKATISSDTTNVAISDSIKIIEKQSLYGPFATATDGEKKTYTIENELLKATLSSKGGYITSVELKKYKTHLGKPLVLFSGDSAKFITQFIVDSKVFSTDVFYFSSIGKSFSVAGADSNSLSMRLYAGDETKYIEYVYSLKGNSYQLGLKMNVVGMQNVIGSNITDMTLQWQMFTPTQEKDLATQRNASTIYFKYLEDEADFLSETKDENKSLDSKVKWIGFKQQFFTSALIADKAFEKPTDIASKSMEGSSEFIKYFTANITIPYNHEPKESFGMSFYFGPNHYKTLKQYDISLEKQIPLGWGIFGWVNRFIVIPIFNFLDGFNLNYGIIILILTLIIKTILFPIAYKTYLSSAKMRVLKPEIDEINKKLGTDDPMKKQQALMGLYKKAGINPLAGCIPLLLQLPILIALFRFFPASIELRQQPFLWAEDLSSYDSILDLSFSIPFYGDHVSLFALLMTISTILYTYSNSQLMSTNEQMPGMKLMMYLMPVIFLGVFNSNSSGLSYYYFLANMITFGQTFLMRRFIDEDALHKKIQEHKKKPVKVSRFQQKLQQMAQEQQKRAQEMRKKK